MSGNESAKLAVLAIEVENAQVERLTGSAPFAFGCTVLATWNGYEAFAAAVRQLGLRAEPHSGERVTAGKSEPVYRYEMTIYIPTDWQPK